MIRPVLKRQPRPHRHTDQRIFRHPHRQSRRLRDRDVHPAQQRAAAGQGDPLVDDVGRQFGRRLFQRGAHRCDDLSDRFGQRLGDLGLGHLHLRRAAVDQVAALDPDDHPFALGRHRTADRQLDALGGHFADHQIMFAADIGRNHLVHLVAADPHRIAVSDAAQRQDRDLRGAAADVDHHRAHRCSHLQPGADRGGQRFLDQLHRHRARVRRRIADRAAFDHRRSRRHTDHDIAALTQPARPTQRLVDEMFDHLFGDVDVGDDAVAQRPDRLNIARRLAHHQLGLVANDLDAPHPVARFQRDDRGFVQDDALVADIDDGVHGPQIDGHVMRGRTEPIKEFHMRRTPLVMLMENRGRARLCPHHPWISACDDG